MPAKEQTPPAPATKASSSIGKGGNEVDNENSSGTSHSQKIVSPQKVTHRPKIGNPLPSNKGGVKSFSLKDLTKKQNPEQSSQTDNDNVPENGAVTDLTIDFTQEQLLEAWKAFAETKKDRPRVYNSLISRAVKKQEETHVFFPVDNQLQYEAMEEILPEIQFFLRNKLQNKNIEVSTRIVESAKPDNKKLYTTKEKYLHLLKINEKLDKFRKDFDLDIE